MGITTSSNNFLKELFDLEEYRDYDDETDEDDLAWSAGQKWTLRTKLGDIMIYGCSYHSQGESQYRLVFYAGRGRRVACQGSTTSPRYIAGGNGTYMPGEPGIHWDNEQVQACRAFLASRRGQGPHSVT